MTQKSIRELAALGATAAMVGGVLIAGAGVANAASDPGFKQVTAPKTVTSGKMFRLKCQLSHNNNWSGAQARLAQKGATINAARPVSAKGNCTMRVVLRATGKQKIRVVVVQNGGAIKSKWLNIAVKQT